MSHRRNGAKPETATSYKTIETPILGEVGAGSVVPFTPREQMASVAIPATMDEKDVGTLVVRGCSLEDLGIYDGDLLIFTKKFTKRDCMFEAICVVYIIPTGELVAKKIHWAGDGMLTLRASGGGVKDLYFAKDDIEIRGVSIGFQRMFKRRL